MRANALFSFRVCPYLTGQTYCRRRHGTQTISKQENRNLTRIRHVLANANISSITYSGCHLRVIFTGNTQLINHQNVFDMTYFKLQSHIPRVNGLKFQHPCTPSTSIRHPLIRQTLGYFATLVGPCEATCCSYPARRRRRQEGYPSPSTLLLSQLCRTVEVMRIMMTSWHNG